VIKCLLIIPFPESSLNQEAGKLFMEDYDQYFKIASIFTNVHATPKDRDRDRNNYDNYCSKVISPVPLNPSLSQGSSALENNSNLNFNNNEQNSNFNCNSNSNCNSNFDFSLLSRHSKSVSFKPSQSSKIVNRYNYVNNANRNNEENMNMQMYNNIIATNSVNKPNINSLPFILRSNSLNNSENENVLFKQPNLLSNNENICCGSGNINNINNLNNMNNGNNNIPNTGSVHTPNSNSYSNYISNANSSYQTPKSKKDEIKKWMSRI
jgi:hypothetical protein